MASVRKKKRKHAGGPPKLGLGRRFSIALLKEQDRYLRRWMKEHDQKAGDAIRSIFDQFVPAERFLECKSLAQSR